MESILKKVTKNKLLIFLMIFAIAAVSYLFKIGFSDLWSDEIYTKSMLSGSLPDFFAKFKNDLHPPLYYLGLRLFTGLFGLNAISLRLFSDAFPEVHQYNQPGEFLQSGELFCAVRFHNLELNKENLDLVLSESELIKTDTVSDNKYKNGIIIQLYLLKYIGK